MKQHQWTAGKTTGRYGLPLEVKYCSRCLASNQRPLSRREHEVDAGHNVVDTLAIGEDGLCDACRIDDAKQLIDWDSRWKELEELCDRHRRDDGRFDCIVPGSGGKDSTLQTWLLKEKLGMHPLTVTAPPTLPSEAGVKNFKAWTAKYPNVTYKPAEEVHRVLTRYAFERLGHPFQPWVTMQQNIGPRAAFDHDVKLVFYGEHFADHGAGGDVTTALRDKAVYTYENLENLRFGGASIAELSEKHNISLADLNLYMPVQDPGELHVAFLGYYYRWHPREAAAFALTQGFEPAPERVSGGYQSDSSIDDLIDEAHYHAAYNKFGGGRAAFQACQDIRNGVITRETGIELVKAFDAETPRHLTEICEYLGMSEYSYSSLIRDMRPEHLFNADGSPKHPVWET